MAAHTVLNATDKVDQAWNDGALTAYVEIGCQFFHIAPTVLTLREAVVESVRFAGPIPSIADRPQWLTDTVDDVLVRVEKRRKEMNYLNKEENE